MLSADVVCCNFSSKKPMNFYLKFNSMNPGKSLTSASPVNYKGFQNKTAADDISY